MKVTTVIPEHETRVEICSEDIVDALFELRRERLTAFLNELAGVLTKITDEQIKSKLTDVQRGIVHKFLTEQAARYG